MKAVYEAPYAIPELGVSRGDVIVVQPAHEFDPLLVVKRFDRNRLPVILDHLHRLTPVSVPDDAPARPSEFRRWLQRRPGRPSTHLHALP